MYGAGNQFLSRPRLSINQHCRVRRRYRFYMFEDFAQRGTVSNDLSKIHFRADFIFQIQLLFGELVFELSNLTTPNVPSTRPRLTRGRMQTVPTSPCAVSFNPSRLASWTLPHQSFAVRKTAPETSSSRGTRLSSWTDSLLKGKSRA